MSTLNLDQLRELTEDKAIEFFNVDRLDHYQERLVSHRNLDRLTQGGLIQALRGLHRLRQSQEARIQSLEDENQEWNDASIRLEMENVELKAKVQSLEAELAERAAQIETAWHPDSSFHAECVRNKAGLTAKVATLTEVLKQTQRALTLLTPSHRSSIAKCWCPHYHDVKQGHSPACLFANVAADGISKALGE